MIIAAIILSVALLVGFIYIITKVDDPDVELAETKAEMFTPLRKFYIEIKEVYND